jgi:hypothetical protein
MVVFIFTPPRVVTCDTAVSPLAPTLEAKVPKLNSKIRATSKRKRGYGGTYNTTTTTQSSEAGPPAKRARVRACARTRTRTRTRPCETGLQPVDPTEVSTHDLLFCDEGPLSASGSGEQTLGSEDYFHKLLDCDEGPLSASASASASGFDLGPASGFGSRGESTSAGISLDSGSTILSLRASLEMAEAEGIISDLCRWDQRSSPDLGHWGHGLLDDLMALWHP